MNIHSSIHQLYPDIEEQLQNRHSALFGKLKSKFCKIYSDLEPEYFVSVKGIADLMIVNSTSLTVKLALENGIIIAIRRTYQRESIYLNTNDPAQEEIQLNYKGELQDGACQLADWAIIGAQAALLDENPKNLYGGIIYLQNTIPMDAFRCREAIILGIACATLLINGLSAKYPTEKIIENILKVDSNNPVYANYFLFQNDKFQLTDGLNYRNLSIKSNQCNWKLLFTDIMHQKSQTQRLQQLSKSHQVEQIVGSTILCNLLKIQKASLFDVIQKYNTEISKLTEIIMKYIKEQYTKSDCQKILGESILLPIEKFYPKKKLLHSLEQYRLLTELQDTLDLSQLEPAFKQSYELQKELDLVSPETDALVKYSLKNGALACTMVDNRFLVMLCEKKNCLGIFNMVRSRIFDNEETDIQHLIFTSLASKGVGILDPSNEIWF